LEAAFLEAGFLEENFLEAAFLEATFLEATFLEATFLEKTFREKRFFETTFIEIVLGFFFFGFRDYPSHLCWTHPLCHAGVLLRSFALRLHCSTNEPLKGFTSTIAHHTKKSFARALAGLAIQLEGSHNEGFHALGPPSVDSLGLLGGRHEGLVDDYNFVWPALCDPKGTANIVCRFDARCL
jgi:hypothetical protein